MPGDEGYDVYIDTPVLKLNECLADSPEQESTEITDKSSVPDYYGDKDSDVFAWAWKSDPAEAVALMRWNMIKYAKRAGIKTADPAQDLDKIINIAKRWKELENACE